jgi:hypothetical protein
MALISDLNIGLRHIFPIYPFLFIAAGVTLARLNPFHPKLIVTTLSLLFLALATESLSAYPNFIPFFNVAAGGSRGGFHYLADSNLDWGQDLPLLASWQRQHPNRTLHLAYFGTADPAYYAIRYHNAPEGYLYTRDQTERLPTTGVLVISATILQSALNSDPSHTTYDPFRHRTPTTILGGSLYLFDLGGN